MLAADLVIDAQVRSATRVRGAAAANVRPGDARMLVKANVLSLIRGSATVAARIAFVVDVPLDARGKAPKLGKARVLLFARPVSGRPDQVQLVGRGAMLPWSAETDAQVRRAATTLVSESPPPAVTGLGNAFHVPGTVEGEGETQIFVTTDTGAPISLQILRRPGQAPSWAVALGDIVDDAAGPPERNTLLWYRLACGLPRDIPDASLEAEDPENARAAREDYALVLRDLGPCRPSGGGL